MQAAAGAPLGLPRMAGGLRPRRAERLPTAGRFESEASIELCRGEARGRAPARRAEERLKPPGGGLRVWLLGEDRRRHRHRRVWP